MRRWHLGRDASHLAWDNALPPKLRVEPGAVVEVDTLDSSGGQIGPDASAAALATLDFNAVNPCTGPIYVDGAEPGDDLVVTFEELEVADWGWTANIPGFGLLADQFPEPHLRVSKVSADSAELLPGLAVPRIPMIGTIGVAPSAPGETPLLVPTEAGGNLDIRNVGRGAVLRLPVRVPGALLSVGDAHASQGDGEVCGTGVETTASMQLRLDLEKGRSRRTPMLETTTASARAGAALVTTGVGPDLFEAARVATLQMIEEVSRRTGLAAVDDYLLLSIAGDLKISEVVDAPNWVVSMHLERTVLD